MNTKLLASIAVFVLLAAVVGPSLTSSAFAASDAFLKIDGVKGESKDTKKAADAKAKADKKAADAKAKADKKAADAKAKADKKAADAKAKADKKAADAKAKADKKEAKTTTSKTSSTSPVKEISVDMAKGTASNQDCADQCYMPSTVNVSVGGKVTWKNVDSAAHTATATDSSFDTSLVNAGASASNTFNTAGTYPYMCILHPWMKGTVNVQ